MRIDGRVRIAALSTWLPSTRERIAEAVISGRLSERDAANSGYEELSVSHDLAAPDMAVRAATQALDRAGVTAAALDLILHSWIYYQGHDFWSPPHYIASELGALAAQPVGVQQMCNGGTAALEAGVCRMLADPAVRCVLITTADRFCPPGFDRWRGDYGLVYGDGATAAVLVDGSADSEHEMDGELELLSIATVAAAQLERMHRGEDLFSPAPRMLGNVVDIRRTKKAFLAAVGGSEVFAKLVGAAVEQVVRRGLSDAGIYPDDSRLRLITLPRVGAAARNATYLPGVSAVLTAEPVDLGGHTGHLGAGDLLANLAAMLGDNLLAPGEIGVSLSAGAGFTWSCVVVRRRKKATSFARSA